MSQRKAKLFNNGRSQAVRLPAAFRFEGHDVYIKKDPVTGDVILSKKPDSWDEFFALVAAIPEAKKRVFLKDRDDRLPQKRDLF